VFSFYPLWVAKSVRMMPLATCRAIRSPRTDSDTGARALQAGTALPRVSVSLKDGFTYSRFARALTMAFSIGGEK
jgi:hypothetical protein